MKDAIQHVEPDSAVTTPQSQLTQAKRYSPQRRLHKTLKPAGAGCTPTRMN